MIDGELSSPYNRDPNVKPSWEPQWRLEDRDGCVIGLTIDDGCYVVLYPHGDEWRPGTHIPPEAARFIAERETGEPGATP